MKNKIKIPKGWDKLRSGTLIKPDDKCHMGSRWLRTRNAGDKVLFGIYIRRIPTRRKKK